jgi:hypothetical protein
VESSKPRTKREVLCQAAVLRWVRPNEVGLVTVSLRTGPDAVTGFALPLASLLDYGDFTRIAHQVFNLSYRYAPAEEDSSGNAWRAYVAQHVAPPEAWLTQRWAEWARNEAAA